jgi:hypothetical protein
MNGQGDKHKRCAERTKRLRGRPRNKRIKTPGGIKRPRESEGLRGRPYKDGAEQWSKCIKRLGGIEKPRSCKGLRGKPCKGGAKHWSKCAKKLRDSEKPRDSELDGHARCSRHRKIGGTY